MSTETTMRRCTKLWTTRDGSKIRICDMSDNHLLNTINMLRRSHRELLNSAYSREASLTGEMAQMMIESEIGMLESEESDHPLFESLIGDAVRRGLKVN